VDTDIIRQIPVQINVHGFRSPRNVNPLDRTSYSDWLNYIKSKLSSISNRITISDFLKRDQFIRNDLDNNPEPKRVSNMIDDPLPPGGRDGWKSSSHASYRTQQRREWGFREKIIQGYPNFDPDKIGYGNLGGKVIAGFVTVGDGIFSGIPQYSDISLDRDETLRQSEYGYGRSTGREMVPTGLSFIQDETGGLGIALGSDVRYTWHPRFYGTNLSNPSISMVDQMHMGSVTIPKADYRQFLRVGDFVVIEIGMRMKYWHSILGGSSPAYWETLVGYRELYDVVDYKKIGSNPPIRSDVLDILNDTNLSRGTLKRLFNVPKVLGFEYRFQDKKPTNIGHQVIEHPWSTGTPIPVNSGMPYVLMEEYIVDSADRVTPAPIIIQASDMRDIKGDGKNPSSNIKGSLVKLMNLRFVSPPTSFAWEIEKSQQSPGIYTSSKDVFAPRLKDRSLFQGNKSLSEVIADKLSERQLNFLTEVPSSYWIDIYKPDLNRFDIENGKNAENIPPDYDFEVWKHSVTTGYGIDSKGRKFIFPSTSKRLDLFPKDIEDDGKLYDRWSPENGMYTTLDLDANYWRTGGDGWLYRVRTSFLGIVLDQERVPGSWPDIIITENDSENILGQTSNKLGLFSYVLKEKTSKFPVTIDEKDGAYWFTNPNIPLTNAIESGPSEAQSTWMVSSTKVPTYIKRDGREFRTVGGLSGGQITRQDSTYYYYYENSRGIKNDWNGNKLKPLGEGYFQPNRVYYLTDDSGTVIPIRINANTEIARFKIPIPTGRVNITGILWQYSMGTPGLEWEREGYVMQVWPRFVSDIEPVIDDSTRIRQSR